MLKSLRSTCDNRASNASRASGPKLVSNLIVFDFGMGLRMTAWLLSRCSCKFGAPAAIATGLLAGAALGANPYFISQNNQEFRPRQIAIKRGETLRFINDDGELLHHAYLSSDSFSFDSGD